MKTITRVEVIFGLAGPAHVAYKIVDGEHWIKPSMLVAFSPLFRQALPNNVNMAKVLIRRKIQAENAEHGEIPYAEGGWSKIVRTDIEERVEWIKLLGPGEEEE